MTPQMLLVKNGSQDTCFEHLCSSLNTDGIIGLMNRNLISKNMLTMKNKENQTVFEVLECEQNNPELACEIFRMLKNYENTLCPVSDMTVKDCLDLVFGGDGDDILGDLTLKGQTYTFVWNIQSPNRYTSLGSLFQGRDIYRQSIENQHIELFPKFQSAAGNEEIPTDYRTHEFEAKKFKITLSSNPKYSSMCEEISYEFYALCKVN